MAEKDSGSHAHTHTRIYEHTAEFVKHPKHYVVNAFHAYDIRHYVLVG